MSYTFLSDVARTLVAQTTQALMRSTGLGLGTAAVVNTGTGASDVPTITQADARYAGITKPLITIPFHLNATGTLTWTSMPSAATALNGQQSRCTLPVDLTLYTQARLTVITGGTGGSAGSKLIVRYKTGAYDGTAANYSDIGTSEVSLAITSSGTAATSSWIPLAAGAKADVQVCIIGSGGNGSTSPVMTLIIAQFQ